MCARILVFLLQEAHIAKLQGALDAGGDASLQNAMSLAMESLRSIPPYGHREVLLLLHPSAMSCVSLTVTFRAPTGQPGKPVSCMTGRKIGSVLAQVLILFAALSTCDPGNIMDAVKAAKEKSVRVSVVGVAAEVHICRVFTKVSGDCFPMRTWLRALLHSRTAKRARDPLGHLSLLVM